MDKCYNIITCGDSMQYDDFILLVKWLKEENIILDKVSLNVLLQLKKFLNPARDCLKTIINDDSILDKTKYLKILVKVGNDYSSLREFYKILENPNIRNNAYFIELIINEIDYMKKSNILRALENPNIALNKSLFDFVFSFKDNDIQRRIINCLEFPVGIESLPKLKNSSKNDLLKILSKIESSIIIEEKNKYISIINNYILNPTTENLDLVLEYEKKLNRYFGTELMIKLDEVKSSTITKNIINSYVEEEGCKGDKERTLSSGAKRLFCRK